MDYNNSGRWTICVICVENSDRWTICVDENSDWWTITTVTAGLFMLRTVTGGLFVLVRTVTADYKLFTGAQWLQIYYKLMLQSAVSSLHATISAVNCV